MRRCCYSFLRDAGGRRAGSAATRPGIRYSGKVQVHPAIVREFEIRPGWVPSLDGPVVFARMLRSTNELTWFEYLLIYAAKVLNASGVGSQLHLLLK